MVSCGGVRFLEHSFVILLQFTTCTYSTQWLIGRRAELQKKKKDAETQVGHTRCPNVINAAKNVRSIAATAPLGEAGP